MKITAPDRWLDDVDIPALRKRLLARGWNVCGSWMNDPADAMNQVFLPPGDMRRWGDWRSRLLETIEEESRLDGITAAEWFARELEAKDN